MNAVLNRWRDGPDTPEGVRERLRACGPDAEELADDLDDESIRVAAAGVRRLYREWAALPAGGSLRLTWPLHDSWLRLMWPAGHRVMELTWFSLGPDRNAFNYSCGWAGIVQLFSLNVLSRQ